MKNIFLTPGHTAKPGLIRSLRPHCSRTHWCHSLILRCATNAKFAEDFIGYWSDLDMAFLAHCTQIWKLNRICMTTISKVARKCIWCCGWAQRCATASTELAGGEILCSGAWKHGQDSHAAVFSLCSTKRCKSWSMHWSYIFLALTHQVVLI